MCEKLWSIFKYVYKTVKYCSRLYSTQNQVLSFYLKKKGVLINFFFFWTGSLWENSEVCKSPCGILSCEDIGGAGIF